MQGSKITLSWQLAQLVPTNLGSQSITEQSNIISGVRNLVKLHYSFIHFKQMHKCMWNMVTEVIIVS